jgi:hypothetical protein
VCRESKNKQMNMAKEKAAGLIKCSNSPIIICFSLPY